MQSIEKLQVIWTKSLVASEFIGEEITVKHQSTFQIHPPPPALTPFTLEGASHSAQRQSFGCCLWNAGFPVLTLKTSWSVGWAVDWGWGTLSWATENDLSPCGFQADGENQVRVERWGTAARWMKWAQKTFLMPEKSLDRGRDLHLAQNGNCHKSDKFFSWWFCKNTTHFLQTYMWTQLHQKPLLSVSEFVGVFFFLSLLIFKSHGFCKLYQEAPLKTYYSMTTLCLFTPASLTSNGSWSRAQPQH